MTDGFSPLPWEDLRSVKGGIPWSALETFADAVAAHPDLARELFTEYNRAWKAVDVPTCIDLYVPAVFALAAPKLDDPQRREIGGFLVDRLIEAGMEEAELTEEALLAAAGSLGPVILPKVLNALESMPADDNEDEADAWSRVWSLTALAAKTDDVVIRERTIRACIRLLEQIDRGEYEAFPGISAAWTLALLKCAEAAPLLQRLSRQIDRIDGGADYREALAFLQGRRTHVYREAWERPVKDWLESSWQMSKEWYAQRDATDSEEEQEAAFAERVRESMDGFLASPQAAGLPEAVAEDAPYITHMLLEYARTYEGAAPEELTKPTLRALLLDVFPRKISAEREFFEKVPVVVESFLRWMASEGTLPAGQSTADAVREWAEESVAAAMDADNWGPAKRFTMEAMRAGVDTTNREALQKYMFQQAQRALAERPYELPEETPITPPIPIVEHSPRIGRNDPCPCGSGKKYKKCCGNSAKNQTANP